MDYNFPDVPVLIKLLLHILPFWAVLFGVIVFFILISFFFYWIIPFFSKKREQEERDRYRAVLGIYIGIVGAFYGILFGLVNINLWQGFHKVQDIVTREASDMSVILSNSAVFAPEMHQKLRAAVKSYVMEVRNDEWKNMAFGQSSPEAWQAIEDFYPLMQSYQPRSPVEVIYYTQIINLLNDAVRARRERLDVLRTSIPPPLYRVLVIGSVLLIFFVCLFTTKVNSFRSLRWLSLLVNILIAFNLYLVIDLGNPFLGRIVISSAPFSEGALAVFFKEQ